MKKIFLILSVIVPISIYTIVELKASPKTCIITTNDVYDNYEKIKQVQCLEIEKDNSKTTGGYYNLYKGKNQCKGYYLEIGFTLLRPVYKNTSTTYKGVNVSSYKYYAENDYYRFYFSL